MRDGQSPESLECSRIETEWSEDEASGHEAALGQSFADVLPPEDLERRLETISDTQFVSAQDFERLTEQYPNEADADGVMRIEVHGQNVRRYAVVKQTALRADTLHTFAYEATHLMAPESNRVADPMREGEDEQVYSVYLGPFAPRTFCLHR